MRILITGGAGFIGSHLMDSLIEDGFKDVVGIDSFANHTMTPNSNMQDEITLVIRFMSVT